MNQLLVFVLLATAPALLLMTFTWRLVWPRWKLVGKAVLHPLLYLGLAMLLGPWSVAIAWVHQGLGLAGHVWFSKKHGFTWYSVEDPERYLALSKASVEALRREKHPSR